MSSLQEIQLGLWGDEVSAGSALPTASRSNLSMVEFRHPLAEREIVLGKTLVGYAVQRARRRSIGMVVGLEGLIVRAPKWVAWGDIETALRAKEKWICNKLGEQRDRASRQQAARIDWRDGACVPYLGSTVTLVVTPNLRHHTLIQQDDTAGELHRRCHLALPPDASADDIRDAFVHWMKQQARSLFAQRVQHYAQRLGVEVTRVSLSSARTRWGSASVDGSIRLHWRLLHFAAPVIDYVVVHELAHLHEMNHSPRFWAVVRSAMPDFESAREHLRHVVLPE